MDTAALRQAYVTDAGVKSICDEMARRERNQTETKLARILGRLSNNGSEIRKNAAIAAFRKLESCGCGQYVEGRRGWPSRFVWSVGSLSACQIAQGANAIVEALPELNTDEEIAAEVDTITHSHRLRDDFSVELQLPSDLTQREAQRLGSFIASLPIDD